MRKCRLASVIGLLAISLIFNVKSAHAAAGSLDPTFGNGGIVIVPGGGIVNDALLQSDGKIVVQGAFGVARFLSDGALDTSFGSGGFAQASASADFGSNFTAVRASSRAASPNPACSNASAICK